MTNDWKVIVVIDPDGGGRDHAYTVGLHDRGRPELFLWARPTDGDDPGADWILSEYDLTSKLDQLGAQLIDGAVAPGATIEAPTTPGRPARSSASKIPSRPRARTDVGHADPGAVDLRDPVDVAPHAHRRRRELEPTEVALLPADWPRSSARTAPPRWRSRPRRSLASSPRSSRSSACGPAASTTPGPSCCWGPSTCRCASPPSEP